MSEELAETVKSGEDLSTGTRRQSDPRRKTAHKTREDEKQHAQKRKERDKKDDDHLFAATVISDLASAERIACVDGSCIASPFYLICAFVRSSHVSGLFVRF